MLLQHFSILPSGNALLMMSAIMTPVGQYLNFTSILDTLPRKVVDDVNMFKSCRCDGVFQDCKHCLVVRVHLDGLQGYIPTSAMSLHSHSASLTAWASAMYSASAVDTATVACSWLDQLMLPPNKMNT